MGHAARPAPFSIRTEGARFHAVGYRRVVRGERAVCIGRGVSADAGRDCRHAGPSGSVLRHALWHRGLISGVVVVVDGGGLHLQRRHSGRIAADLSPGAGAQAARVVRRGLSAVRLSDWRRPPAGRIGHGCRCKRGLV